MVGSRLPCEDTHEGNQRRSLLGVRLLLCLVLRVPKAGQFVVALLEFRAVGEVVLVGADQLAYPLVQRLLLCGDVVPYGLQTGYGMNLQARCYGKEGSKVAFFYEFL